MAADTATPARNPRRSSRRGPWPSSGATGGCRSASAKFIWEAREGNAVRVGRASRFGLRFARGGSANWRWSRRFRFSYASAAAFTSPAKSAAASAIVGWPDLAELDMMTRMGVADTILLPAHLTMPSRYCGGRRSLIPRRPRVQSRYAAPGRRCSGCSVAWPSTGLTLASRSAIIVSARELRGSWLASVIARPWFIALR